MAITFRREEKKDYRAVEELVRESFWNVYRPGCLEHYVLKHLQRLMLAEDERKLQTKRFVKQCVWRSKG